MINSSDMVAALTADYLNVYVVEPELDTGEIVKTEGWVFGSELENPGAPSYSRCLQAYSGACVHEDDRDAFREHLSLESIMRTFSDGRRRFEFNYRVRRDGEIHRYSVQYVRISSEGEPLKLVVGFRCVDDIVSAQKEKRDEGLNSAYSVISQVYLSMHRVNVQKNTYYAIKTTDAITQLEIPGNTKFDENARRIIQGLAVDSDYQGVLEFLDLGTLEARMRDKAHISIGFIGKFAGSCELHFLKEDEDEQGRLKHVIFAVELVDEDRFGSAFDVLARNYQNVFWIDLNAGKARILKLNGYVTKGMDREDRQYFAYDQLLGQYISDRVHPDDQEMLAGLLGIDNLRKTFAGKSELVGNYHVLDGGQTHYYQYNYYKIQGMDYAVCGFQNIDDIVEKSIEQERAQRARENEYRNQLEEQLLIMNNLTRGFRNVYVANTNEGTARILKVDESYDFEIVKALSGKTFPYDAVIEKWCDVRVVPEDRERVRASLNTESVRRALATQDEYVGVYRSYDLGTVCNYQYVVSKLNDEGSVLIGFQVIDSIIEEHLAEERKQRAKEEEFRKQLVAAKDEADRANSAKTEFLLRMSHDIRTPLNGIMGMLDIADKFPDDLERQADCRQKIKDSSRILLELINEVLDMSKLESGEIVLENIPFDLADVAKELHSVVSKQAEECGVEIIQVDCDAGHRRFVGSPLHYKRMMMNILSNAIKYNKEHGKVYVTCREVGFENGVASVEFKCRDTGIGMTPEFQKHMFEPFAQEGASSRSKYAGTGLGMSIAKSIVDKMGGTISFESTLGEGTTFDVVIPFAVDTSEASEASVGRPASKPSIAGFQLLLVEDNELNMEIAAFLLENAGAKVTQVFDGQAAVDAVAQSEPGYFDAVLMDVMMPVLDGYDATRAIRALDHPDAQRVPIVAMTANAFVEDRLAAKEAGMDEHIAKPLDPDLVVETVARLVREKDRRQG